MVFSVHDTLGAISEQLFKVKSFFLNCPFVCKEFGSGAVLEQFQSSPSKWLVIQLVKNLVPEHTQSTFRAVLEQFQTSFRPFSEQFFKVVSRLIVNL